MFNYWSQVEMDIAAISIGAWAWWLRYMIYVFALLRVSIVYTSTDLGPYLDRHQSNLVLVCSLETSNLAITQ